MVGRAKKTPKIEHFGLKVCSLGPRGDPHMRPRGNPHGPQGNLRLDLEATCNDRKQAIPHPRKQRRRSLWSDILLCFLGCGIARFLSLRRTSKSVRVASRSMQVASRSHRGLPRGLMFGSPRGPSEQTCRPKFLVLGGFLALLTETSLLLSKI